MEHHSEHSFDAPGRHRSARGSRDIRTRRPRVWLRVGATLVAAGCGMMAGATGSGGAELPRAVQTDNADPRLVATLEGYYEKKTDRDVAGTMAYFSPGLVTYIDATLGWDTPGFAALKGVFETYMPKWTASAMSYPTRIMGSPESALVAFTDTPELFGGELRILGAVDLVDGKVVRWVDYWDASAFDDTLYKKIRTPADKYPRDFKENKIESHAAPEMIRVATALQKAYSEADAAGAATLMGDDVVYDDMALRTQIIGRAAVGRYLGRVLADIPYGKQSRLRHVVGGQRGGGFEWIAAPESEVPAGITALVLDADGRISRLTTVYDSKLLKPTLKAKLVGGSEDH